jgi:hypothetical protein
MHSQQNIKKINKINVICTERSKIKLKMFSCNKESANRLLGLSVLGQCHYCVSCELNKRNLNSNNFCNYSK